MTELKMILNAACEATGLSIQEMLSKSRMPQVTEAKIVAVGCMRDIPRSTPSFPEIARAMRRTSHSGMCDQYRRWRLLAQWQRDSWRTDVAAKLGSSNVYISG